MLNLLGLKNGDIEKNYPMKSCRNYADKSIL
jgi:hypothetical protein